MSELISKTVIRATIRAALVRGGVTTLSELVKAFQMVQPEVTPASLHDILNDMIQDGTIVLTLTGTYRAP